MKFWDSSALVPLCVEESRSGPVREILREDPEGAVWWGTIVECRSALARRLREGKLGEKDERLARERLRDLVDHLAEVSPTEEVRDHASVLLRRHPLRAADALQLGAAMVLYGTPASGEVVTLDRRLARAADGEGLRAIPVL